MKRTEAMNEEKNSATTGAHSENSGAKSERQVIREKVINRLLSEKGYSLEDLELGRAVKVELDGTSYVSPVDIIIKIGEKRVLMIKCAPGSVVTRENQLLAAARLFGEYQIPLACQTNGEEIEVLDVLKGKVILEGWEKFPARRELERMAQSLRYEPLPEKHRIRETRILRLYDELT